MPIKDLKEFKIFIVGFGADKFFIPREILYPQDRVKKRFSSGNSLTPFDDSLTYL